MKNLKKFVIFLFATVAIFFCSNFFNSNVVFATDKVNINTANATELDTIPEVGPATATKIITYRETIGPFIVIEDIMKVSGIKEATFAKLKDYITVGDNSADNLNEEISTTTASTTDSSVVSDGSNENSSNTSSNIVSVHYYQENLSDYNESLNIFEVSAGRERLAYVGSPISFEIKYKSSSDLKNKVPNGTWSFGDGTSLVGNKVIHTYKYPGEYNVVLNANLSELNSIARTKVKILKPSLSFSILSDMAIEIFNHGTSEINLYGFKIMSSGQTYTFPLDTIISANKSVIFPAEYLKLTIGRDKIILTDASGNELGFLSKDFIASGLTETVSIAEYEKFAIAYKNLTTPKNTNSIISNNINIPMTASIISSIVSATSSLDNQTEDTFMEEPVEAPTRGFWSSVFHPIKTIKDTFYK